MPAVQNGDAADVAAAVIASSVAQVSNTLAAATVASPTQAPATASGLPTARTAMAGLASTQKAGAPDPTPVSSQNPQQGPRISSVLQQIEALQGSATVQSPTASVTFDLAQTAAQSQLSQAAERSALADVSASQTAATSDEPAANDARNAPSSPGNPTLVGAAQHSAAATNSYSTGQDSSSNQREQNLSDAQAPSDS
ncbi:MAG: hypothetical protein ACRD51_05735, partial [Candidatus Acidiferrum sp.]